MLILIIFAFLSGIVTILSPCILPMLPIVLTGSIGDKKRPYGILVGFILSFSILSLTLSWIIRLFNIPSNSLRVIAITFIIIFGLIMVIPSLKDKFDYLISSLNRRKSATTKRSGFIGGVIIGLTLGIIWTPCVGPIMASVIALAATQTITLLTVLIIIFYSLGTGIPMLIIILTGRKIINKFPSLSNNSKRIQRFFGVIMIMLGISISLDLDRKFQTTILNIFPKYGSGLTLFETTDIVQDALKIIDNSELRPRDKEPKNAILGNYGLAPEFILNDLGIDLESLKGKVVIVDFWTYSCINCVRTIPYLKSWYDTYKEYGLEIIGVHTPEFAFERSINNVNKAKKDLGVNWPVILDNNYKQWNSYNNRYWPAKYFIDANGVIRYFHFGEGEYDTSEKVIRKLLIEAGVDLSEKAEKQEIAKIESNTPEIYLGYGRARGFNSNEKIAADKFINYTINSELENGQWALKGNWKIENEYIEPLESGELQLSFDSKNVFIVVETDSEGIIEIVLDGKVTGKITPTQSKLYKLVELNRRGKHSLELRVKGDLRLFAFTFG